MLPPPCFIVRMVCSGWRTVLVWSDLSSFFFLLHVKLQTGQLLASYKNGFLLVTLLEWLIIVPWTHCPTWAVHCSMSRVTRSFLAASQIDAFFFWRVLWGQQPRLGRSSVVSYPFHFQMVDWTELCDAQRLGHGLIMQLCFKMFYFLPDLAGVFLGLHDAGFTEQLDWLFWVLLGGIRGEFKCTPQ